MQKQENLAIIIPKILYSQRIFIYIILSCYMVLSRKQKNIQPNLSILFLFLLFAIFFTTTLRIICKRGLKNDFFFNCNKYIHNLIIIVHFIFNESRWKIRTRLGLSKARANFRMEFSQLVRFLSSFLSNQDDISMRNIAIISGESRFEFEQINSMCQVITLEVESLFNTAWSEIEFVGLISPES